MALRNTFSNLLKQVPPDVFGWEIEHPETPKLDRFYVDFIDPDVRDDLPEDKVVTVGFRLVFWSNEAVWAGIVSRIDRKLDGELAYRSQQSSSFAKLGMLLQNNSPVARKQAEQIAADKLSEAKEAAEATKEQTLALGQDRRVALDIDSMIYNHKYAVRNLKNALEGVIGQAQDMLERTNNGDMFYSSTVSNLGRLSTEVATYAAQVEAFKDLRGRTFMRHLIVEAENDPERQW